MGSVSEAVNWESLCVIDFPTAPCPSRARSEFSQVQNTLRAASNNSCHLTSRPSLLTGTLLLINYLVTESPSSEMWTLKVASIKSGSGHNRKTTFFSVSFQSFVLHLLCWCFLDFMPLQKLRGFFHKLVSLNKLLTENAVPSYSATDGETKSKRGKCLTLVQLIKVETESDCIFSY